MQTLFDQKVYQNIISRLDSLTENHQPQWGEMTVAQMVKHCQMPLLVANGKMELNRDISLFKKLIYKFYKPIMYNDKSWPENIPTPAEFKITAPFVFDAERQALKNAITEFHGKALNMRWPAHPFFGNFNTDQWGKMQYKHLDHHFRQFGV